MADDAGGALGPLEAEVMAVLWREPGGLSVRQTAGRLNEGRTPSLAYTTVMTVLTRLTRKGIVSRTRINRAFAYRPLAADVADIAVRGVLAAHGDAALTRFVERVELDPGLRDRLRRLMGEP